MDGGPLKYTHYDKWTEAPSNIRIVINGWRPPQIYALLQMGGGLLLTQERTAYFYAFEG